MFPSVTAGMTAISVGYMVCLIPLLVVLYRLPRVSYEPSGAAGRRRRAGAGRHRAGRRHIPAGPAAPAAAGGPGIRALLSLEQGFGLVWAGKFLITLAETVALLYLYYYVQDSCVTATRARGS